MPKKSTRLSDRDENFCHLLLTGMSRDEAYKVGHPKCSDRTAASQGSRKAREPRVKERLRELRAIVADKITDRVAMSSDDALQRLYAMLRASIADVINKDGTLKGPLEDLTEDQRAAIKLIDQNGVVHFYDQKSLLEMLMKHHGLFNKDQTQAVPVNVNITMRKEEGHDTDG